MDIFPAQHCRYRFASAGGGAVRGAVAVCLRRRGPWGGCAGRLTRAFGAGQSGRVAVDGHFSARTAAALPLPAEKAVWNFPVYRSRLPSNSSNVAGRDPGWSSRYLW
jgi:hypothetical protein